MRCKICNKGLTPSEASKRDHKTNEFSDTCYRCSGEIYKTIRGFEQETHVTTFDIEPIIDLEKENLGGWLQKKAPLVYLSSHLRNYTLIDFKVNNLGDT